MNYSLSEHIIELIAVEGEFYGYGSFDIRENDEWVAVFKIGKNKKFVLCCGDKQIPVPESCKFPIVRFLQENVLIINTRIQKQGEINAWIIALDDGRIINSFSVGDGVSNVEMLEDFIVVSYFDEGIFSGISPSDEGIAFFSQSGQYICGYFNDVPHSLSFIDCYATCKSKENQFIFYSYDGFEIVQVDVCNKAQIVTNTPEKLHGASSVSKLGDIFFLYGVWKDRKLNKEVINAFDSNTKEYQIIGKISGKYCRGLEGGRFLSYSDGQIIITSIVSG